MADSRFFDCKGPFSLKEIAEWTGAELPSDADGSRTLSDVAALDKAEAEHVSFLDNPKYLETFKSSKAGACLVKAKYADKAPEGMITLICADPYRAYAAVAAKFYPPTESEGISPRASIHETAQIGKNTTIGAGTAIGAGVQIGSNCRIAPNCTITHSIIGDNVIIHPGVNIGQDGFGFAMGAGGHIKVPQLGRVVIESNVEIGAGTCIDRGAGPDTIIGEGAKIDNLVQIGHNVQVGKHAVIVSQVGISGSTVIGDYAVIGGQVGIAGHLQIGSGAQLAARTGVTSDLEAGKIYGGTPAMPIRDWHRQTAALKKLIKIRNVNTES